MLQHTISLRIERLHGIVQFLLQTFLLLLQLHHAHVQDIDFACLLAYTVGKCADLLTGFRILLLQILVSICLLFVGSLQTDHLVESRLVL